MSHDTVIIEAPRWHFEYIIKLIQFSTENPSLKQTQIENLRKIESNIVTQLDRLRSC